MNGYIKLQFVNKSLVEIIKSEMALQDYGVAVYCYAIPEAPGNSKSAGPIP